MSFSSVFWTLLLDFCLEAQEIIVILLFLETTDRENVAQKGGLKCLKD